MTKDEYYKGKTNNGHIHPEIGRKRHLSRELDYGVMWAKSSLWPQYRVTWVENTGEVIIVQLSNLLDDKDQYEIIGTVKTEETIEKLFKGWADACGGKKSLNWIYDKFGIDSGESDNNEERKAGRCNERCQYALKDDCDCICGGKNHKSALHLF